jgi:Fe-S cluster assembly protein SufD
MSASSAATARDRFLAEYRRRSNGQEGPSWLGQLRNSAIDAFAARGFPTTRDDSWRFTNLAPMVETPFTLSAPAAPGIKADAARWSLTQSAGNRLVFVNGRLHEGLSVSSSLPKGVLCQSLAAALSENPRPSSHAFSSSPSRATWAASFR